MNKVSKHVCQFRELERGDIFVLLLNDENTVWKKVNEMQAIRLYVTINRGPEFSVDSIREIHPVAAVLPLNCSE